VAVDPARLCQVDVIAAGCEREDARDASAHGVTRRAGLVTSRLLARETAALRRWRSRRKRVPTRGNASRNRWTDATRRDAAHHALAKARGLVRVLDAMVAPHRGVDLPGLGAGQLGPVREGRRVAASPVGHATAGTRLTVRRPPAAHVLIAERSRASLDTARP
jgi:hypothetical protein